MPTYVILNKLSHYCPENHRHLIPFNIGTTCGTIQGKTEELPVHLGMTPIETPLPIVYFKLLFHIFLVLCVSESKSTNIFPNGQIIYAINDPRSE